MHVIRASLSTGRVTIHVQRSMQHKKVMTHHLAVYHLCNNGMALVRYTRLLLTGLLLSKAPYFSDVRSVLGENHIQSVC